MSFHVIASEVKQSSFAATRKLDCFVASLLAMTARATRRGIAKPFSQPLNARLYRNSAASFDRHGVG
jgi:hypothetical protein